MYICGAAAVEMTGMVLIAQYQKGYYRAEKDGEKDDLNEQRIGTPSLGGNTEQFEAFQFR